MPFLLNQVRNIVCVNTLLQWNQLSLVWAIYICMFWIFLFETEKCIVEGHIIHGNHVHSGIGYPTSKEAKFECSKGKTLLCDQYLNFITSCNVNNDIIWEVRLYSIFYSGHACSGITFESDTKKWTPMRGSNLIVSPNLEDKSILRSCYGKKTLRNEYVSWKVINLWNH